MKKISLIHAIAASLTCLFALTAPAPASARPLIECKAFTSKDGDLSNEVKLLEFTEYDPEYMETSIGNYSFGADLSTMGENEIGFIIFNNQTKRSAIAGSRLGQTPGTNWWSANIRFYDVDEAGIGIVTGIDCYREAP